MPKVTEHRPPLGEMEPNTLILEDEALKGGFVMLPKVVLYARNLSRDAKLLYAILLGYAWQEQRCFPGYGRLCHDMQLSENMVRKAMKELEATGLLSQKRRGLGLTNIYRLPPLRTAQLEVSEPHSIEVPEPRNPEPHSIEVPEPQYAEAPEPQPTEGYKESEGKRIRRGSSGSNSTPPGDNLGIRAVPRRQRPRTATPYLDRVIVDLTDQLHDDPENVEVNQSRARRLMLKANLPEEEFVRVMYEARQDTLASNVQKRARDGRNRNKMPYFFAVLEDLLGLKEADAGASLPR